MNNTYSAPVSALVQTADDIRSIEAATAGDYEFGAMNTISEAWEVTSGFKRYLLGAGIVMYVIVGVVLGIVGAIFGGVLFGGGGDAPPNPFSMIIAQLIMQPLVMAVMMPFVGGIVVMCLKQIKGQPVEFGDLFSAFNKTLPLLLAAILINIMVLLGMVFFILPGIYLGVSYLLVVPLIVDRDLGVWEAMEASRKAITRSWFSVFGMYFLLCLIMMVSMLPLFIGLIWTIPLFALSIIMMYQKMFGIASY